MATISFLELLDKKSLTKKFYEESRKYALRIVLDKKIDFSQLLSKKDLTILNGYIHDLVDLSPLIEELNEDDLVDDDVFGFVVQELLVDTVESSDPDEDTIYELKKFLTYHVIYKEAMEGSAYDKIIRANDGAGMTTEPKTQSYEPSEPVKKLIDLIDEKYKNPVYIAPKSKIQKPEMYKGCKVIIEGNNIGNHIFPQTWDDRIIKDDQDFEHDAKKAHVIFKTEVPGVGDIAFCEASWYLIGDKETLETIKNYSSSANYYTTKFNNRKVEKLNVKRFSCGTLDKDLSNIPYHVEVIYEDIKVEYDFDAIAKHYRLSHDALVRKEVDLIKELEITLDHPLNVARSEWAYLVGQAGSGKTQVAIEYAKNKGKEYILQQGHAQLTVDDLLGYKSITDGTYFPSLLRDAVENGKIFIIDEMDACNPNTLLALNSLKNKTFQFPDTLVEIHPDFRLIATLNTLEYSDVYNGRSKLDMATITRGKVINADLEEHHLALRYGLDYIKNIQNIDRLTPREIEREVTDQMIKKQIELEKEKQN